MTNVIVLDEGDQVAITVRAIPPGHKVARTAIARGEAVLRLGQPIGLAAEDIAPGDWVHTHNLRFEPSGASHAIGARLSNMPRRAAADIPDYLGYVRPDGRVGTRNYVGVLTTVNCSALVARMIADHFRGPDFGEHYPGVDGVVALTHKSGCSVADGTASMDMLRRVLAGYARHPNFSGVLLVGLGCEDNQLDRLVEEIGPDAGTALATLTIQDTGGTRTSIARGIEIVEGLLARAMTARREKVPAGTLSVGLQCGGSDGFSGITANPALGAAVDRLVACGGTAILAETTEIYGAENLLLERAVSREVGERLVGLLEWWEAHTRDEPAGFDNNPSPGNREGGLTTILEKSLGAVAKGGRSNLEGVFGYGQPVDTKGLVFMDSPGFDPISATGQVASGANMIAFTTGRGSCFGCRPAPSIKLASTSELYRRMEEDMDIDCGPILSGEAGIEDMGEAIFRTMLAVASGAPTKSEQLGYGEDEFAPWHVNAWL